MYYLKAFINSFYNFEWLRAQANNGKKAANYIVLFILFLSLVSALFLAIMTPKMLREVRDEIFSQVPDFTASMENNILTVTDIDQPFVFEDEEVILRLDTTSSSTDFDFASFVSGKSADVVYFTSTTLYSYDGATGVERIMDYRDFPNKSFTKASLQELTDDFLGNTKLFFGIFLIMSFIGFSVFKLVNLLFVSLIILLINKNSQSEKLKFGQIYTIGLFALTGPSVLIVVLRAFQLNISFLYSILLLVILVIATGKKVEMTKVEGETKVLEADSENVV